MAPVGWRRCVVCRRLAHRSEFWRIVREGTTVKLDEGRGRSVYVCRGGSCLAEGLKKNRLGKALRHPIPEAVLAELRGRINSSQYTDNCADQESDRS